MSARSRGTNDDMNLSLTGSQISSAKRSWSAKQIKRPNSMIDIRDRNAASRLSTKKSTVNKNLAGGGPETPTSQQSTHRGRYASGRSKAADPGEDFLALFENTVQPKLRTPSNKSHNAPTSALFESTVQPKLRTPSNKSRNPLTSGVKVSWSGVPQKNFPVSSRSTSTVQSEVRSDGDGGTSPINGPWGHTDSDSSPEEMAQELQDQLSQSLQDIRELTKKLSVVEHKPQSQNSEDTNNVLSFNSAKTTFHPGVESIANNMTLQGMSPKAKVSLSSIENSYQNIKHKTPVNLMMKGASTSHVGRTVTEDFMKTKHISATKIQRWYRRHTKQTQVQQAAVRRLLQQKSVKIEEIRRESLNFAVGVEYEAQRSEDRKNVREEKAKKARQQAIEDLHKMREDRKREVKKKAEEEIVFLQASGKIRKKALIGSHKQTKDPKSSRSDSDTDRLSSKKLTHGAVVDLQSPRIRSRRESQRDDQEEVEEMDHTLVPSDVTTKSTLDDLLDTLHKLEQDEQLMSTRQKKNNSWVEGLDGESGQDDSEVLTMENLEKHKPPNQDLTNKSTFLTDEKLRSIMNFLDEVQVADRLNNVDQELSKINDELEKPALLVPSVAELVKMNQTQDVADEITNTNLAQRLDREEKKRTVGMLQKALSQQRELTIRHARDADREMKQRLDVQKDEYEETIKRHLGFIDQLIDDKKYLSGKCEELVKELKTCDRKYQDRMKAGDDKHGVEIQKLSDMHEAAEKLRREKWIQDKTKRIKEMTVKGLEPEIQRLIAKHKSELKKIKQIHEAELLESDERAAQRYVKMTEELRDQLAKEKESACAREREMVKQRYEKQLQQEEEAYQQQRRRLHSEVQEEKERISTQASRQSTELDKLRRQLEDNHKITRDTMKSEFDKTREEQERRHNMEIRDLQERLKVEKESWEENYMKKRETWLMQKERELKESVRKDRDKEIELVINRLEEDATVTRQNCEKTAENKIRRIREKYDAEIRDLEHTEKQALEKYSEMKGRVAEVEGENECFKVQLKQKDQEIVTLQKLTNKMHEERNRVSDIIRQEFADRLVATDEENKRIKTEISELKARHRIELDHAKEQIEDIKKQKEDELEEVHKRVKQAIVKKEEVLNQLKQQHQAALKRADHLEGLLQQQRKQLLTK